MARASCSFFGLGLVGTAQTNSSSTFSASGRGSLAKRLGPAAGARKLVLHLVGVEKVQGLGRLASLDALALEALSPAAAE